MTDDSPGTSIIAIDPGRDKCGLAVLGGDGRLLRKSIVRTPELAEALAAMLEDTPRATVVIGDGTASDAVRAAIAEAMPEVTPALVGEHRSTERALERWRDVEPPRGWRRLLPRSLRFPPDAIDDFAAWILAEDYLRGGPIEDH